MKTPEILLLGGPNSGKTHYAGQLYGRLKRRPNNLKIRSGDGSSVNLIALEGVLTNLEDGNAAEHTPSEQYDQILFPLVDSKSNELDLYWPDYGGEQLKLLFEQREVPSAWRERLESSDGWLLFIRLSSETTYPEAITKLASLPEQRPEKSLRQETWDANAYWIELLQVLCSVANYGITSKESKPPLAILLSCFDEYHIEGKEPKEVLKQKLPLFYQFISSNWLENDLSVWGVSALGKNLSHDSNDDGFIDDGPEYQGWVIPHNETSENSDLTAPICWLIDKTT
ncbi:hypothetical protein ACN9JF_17275 (plasmid) [Pseudoalteromonas lipolytica]|uniref:TRAFAC clade GTPase domain-containing protein n=1 Tax=Pseudoalteromonas lipolytica TaxID=570156 RepID=UPI003B9ED854